MKIVFMGTPDFAIPTLEALLESSHLVAGVVTRQDKPKGRGRKLLPSPVKAAAEKYGLPVLQPESLKSRAFLERLSEWGADVFVVVAFLILPPEVFKLPPKGTINLHASLLPKYRGAAPIQWALINGENETGVTTFFIDEHVDTGNILLQEKVKIYPEDTAEVLRERLAYLGGKVMVRTLDLLERGELEPKPQAGEATRAPKIRKEDCEINWSQPAGKIVNLIRGVSPVPGAFTYFRGKIFKIHRAKVSEHHTHAKGLPGEIVYVHSKKGLIVRSGEGTIELIEVQPAGGKRMSALDFLRGHRIQKGEILGKSAQEKL
ncbi:methionyl-tRNA formyltransferase [bacterium BMS3Abin05]|nr:methionyl-tRNA formyltransferase [bacterium BMS3Abin05]GBE26268.1 methionyl-tRNA formyltransferase [bacterium BMS3Bbin03]HDK35486.1 methionyl-tRNA formyltransferase [Bacteroidota bacterium]HDZ10890.1 methionyl-tRNA formyltransferase [Bacteroidota bacterium]